MKLNIISDLHCLPQPEENEFGFHTNWYGFEPEKLEPADYLIVAGDMGIFENHIDVVKELRLRTEEKFKDILWIRGNHDYWLNASLDWFQYTEKDFTGIYPNKTIDVVNGNVAIIGTTLWTNSISYSELCRMNDYRNIPNFSAYDKLQEYDKQSKWLREKYNEYKQQGKRVVIVTHHNPRECKNLPEYSLEHNDVRSAYWVNDTSKDWENWRTEIEKLSFSNFNKGLIQDVNDLKPDLWICGHIHENFDGEIGGVRFVRHPIGYRWGIYRMRPDEFPEHGEIIESWYNKIVEI